MCGGDEDDDEGDGFDGPCVDDQEAMIWSILGYDSDDSHGFDTLQIRLWRRVVHLALISRVLRVNNKNNKRKTSNKSYLCLTRSSKNPNVRILIPTNWFHPINILE